MVDPLWSPRPGRVGKLYKIQPQLFRCSMHMYLVLHLYMGIFLRLPTILHSGIQFHACIWTDDCHSRADDKWSAANLNKPICQIRRIHHLSSQQVVFGECQAALLLWLWCATSTLTTISFVFSVSVANFLVVNDNTITFSNKIQIEILIKVREDTDGAFLCFEDIYSYSFMWNP